MKHPIRCIVVGALNTDICALSVSEIVGPGEYSIGEKLFIGPGGKSRNMASMVAALYHGEAVSMLGRTAKDPYGLWKVPLDALRRDKVDVSHVSFSKNGFPGIALIPVDTKGRNQIYVVRGESENFSVKDIRNARSLFEKVAKNRGIILATLETPLEVVREVLALGRKLSIQTFLDPGGITKREERAVLKEKPFFIKPNEFEAEMLTGIRVKDNKSAERAGNKLLDSGCVHVLITRGKQGACYLTNRSVRHLPAPPPPKSRSHDETGCGDQTMAGIVSGVLRGETIPKAIQSGLTAASIQFSRPGIVPVTAQELKRHLARLGA